MNDKDRLFELLFTKSFMYRDNPPFTLVSGKQSPYYFDCKATTLDPEGCILIGKCMYQLIKDLQVDAIGGLTLGADPISLSTAMEAYSQGKVLYPLIVRKDPKKHGTQKWIEGNTENVKNVIAIDDVITTGGSTITAIERLTESRLNVIAAAVIIDREEGGREAIEERGIKVLSLFTRSDFDNKRSG